MGDFIVSRKIGDAFFWTIILLATVVFFNLDASYSVFVISFISAIFFLFLGRTRLFDSEYKKYIITVHISIFYVSIFNLLGVHNSSAPYLFFLGTAIISMYEDKAMVFYYSFSIIIFNTLFFIINPSSYFINHTTTNWFYIAIIFAIHTTICYFGITKDPMTKILNGGVKNGNN